MDPLTIDRNASPLSRTFRGMRIAASALDAERTRIDIISKNVANARTTRVPGEDGPYRREVASFRALMNGSFGSEGDIVGVQVDEVMQDSAPFEEVYDPTHPDANDKGIVLYPNVNTMKEMADLVTAVRSYEANLSVVETTERMADRALRLAE